MPTRNNTCAAWAPFSADRLSLSTPPSRLPSATGIQVAISMTALACPAIRCSRPMAEKIAVAALVATRAVELATSSPPMSTA